ncbi:MAG: DUF3579 domain-containing protein [Burkholderiaceae bacterium]
MPDSDQPRSFVILGKTVEGAKFRPSDWAERLCGVMSSYRPGSKVGGHLTYSPWVMPGQEGGFKCVRVDAKIYQHEPLAFRFLLSFASDNNLVVNDVPDSNPNKSNVKSTDSSNKVTKSAVTDSIS